MVEITYHQEGDFFVPDLYLKNEDYENDYIIGKYGNLRLKYLKNHKKVEYIIMFMNKTLRKHIVETDINNLNKDLKYLWNKLYLVFQFL